MGKNKDGTLTLVSLIVTVITLYVAALSYILPNWSTKLVIILITSLVTLVLLFIFFRKTILKSWEKIFFFFKNSMPIFVVLNLVFCFFIYKSVHSKVNQRFIEIKREKGAIFNSWFHQPSHKKQIFAWGSLDHNLMWTLDEDKSGRFSYDIDTTITNPHPDACSGGYITFYDRPCDRLTFNTLSFKLRATDFEGKPDIGIRLAVDDPKSTQDREKVAYELSSLNSYLDNKKSISNNYDYYVIDVSDFDMKRIEPPLPDGIDENTINKIVFFINGNIVNSCSKATIWIKDITFNLN